jgi:hypothetical protein
VFLHPIFDQSLDAGEERLLLTHDRPRAADADISDALSGGEPITGHQVAGDESTRAAESGLAMNGDGG